MIGMVYAGTGPDLKCVAWNFCIEVFYLALGFRKAEQPSKEHRTGSSMLCRATCIYRLSTWTPKDMHHAWYSLWRLLQSPKFWKWLEVSLHVSKSHFPYAPANWAAAARWRLLMVVSHSPIPQLPLQPMVQRSHHFMLQALCSGLAFKK